MAFSAITFAAALLAGVTLVQCGKTEDRSNPLPAIPMMGVQGTGTLDVNKVLNALPHFSSETRDAIIEPLQKLNSYLKNTIFGTIFDDILSKIRGEQSENDVSRLKEQLSLKSLTADIENLSQDTIDATQPIFQDLIEKLSQTGRIGEAQLAQLLREIAFIMSLRETLLQYGNLDEVIPSIMGNLGLGINPNNDGGNRQPSDEDDYPEASVPAPMANLMKRLREEKSKRQMVNLPQMGALITPQLRKAQKSGKFTKKPSIGLNSQGSVIV